MNNLTRFSILVVALGAATYNLRLGFGIYSGLLEEEIKAPTLKRSAPSHQAATTANERQRSPLNVAPTTQWSDASIFQYENEDINTDPEVFAFVGQLQEGMCQNLWPQTGIKQQICLRNDSVVVELTCGSGWGGNVFNRYWNLYALAVWHNWGFHFKSKACMEDSFCRWMPQQANQTNAPRYHDALRKYMKQQLDAGGDAQLTNGTSLSSWQPLPFRQIHSQLASTLKGLHVKGKCHADLPAQCGGYFQNQWIKTVLVEPVMRNVIAQYRSHSFSDVDTTDSQMSSNSTLGAHDIVIHLRCGDIILTPASETGFMPLHYWLPLIDEWIAERISKSSSPISMTIWISSQTTKESLRPGRTVY